MLQAPQNYLPVQQAAVQQQIQQTPVQAPVAPAPAPIPGPEYNAIKIDIIKPEVKPQQDTTYAMPYNPIYEYPTAQQ